MYEDRYVVASVNSDRRMLLGLTNAQSSLGAQSALGANDRLEIQCSVCLILMESVKVVARLCCGGGGTELVQLVDERKASKLWRHWCSLFPVRAPTHVMSACLRHERFSPNPTSNL